MTYALSVSTFPGVPSIEAVLPVLAPGNVLPWPPIPLGHRVVAYDPVWGGAEFIFAKAGGTIRQFGLCVLTPTLNSTTRQYEMIATECPNTANLGRQVYVAAGDGGLVINQFGWFMLAGLTPINGTATVASGTVVGITAAGQVGASSAGKEVEGAVSMLAATNTVVKAIVSGVTGTFTVQVANTDGLFCGGYVAGTGIAATSFITAIDRVNNVLTLSVALTGAASGNLTQTANNATIFYNACHVEGPTAQGRIT